MSGDSQTVLKIILGKARSLILYLKHRIHERLVFFNNFERAINLCIARTGQDKVFSVGGSRVFGSGRRSIILHESVEERLRFGGL